MKTKPTHKLVRETEKNKWGDEISRHWTTACGVEVELVRDCTVWRYVVCPDCLDRKNEIVKTYKGNI